MSGSEFDITQESERKLNDADAQAIADAMWKRLRKELYLNAGRGLIGLLWKMLIIGLVILAVYGYSHSWLGSAPDAARIGVGHQ